MEPGEHLCGNWAPQAEEIMSARLEEHRHRLFCWWAVGTMGMSSCSEDRPHLLLLLPLLLLLHLLCISVSVNVNVYRCVSVCVSVYQYVSVDH